MSFTDTITISYNGSGGGGSVSANYSTSGTGRAGYSGTVADTTATAGQSVDCAFLHAEVLSAFLLASQDCTINVNSDSSPAQVVTLLANTPVLANPFTVDVTKLYIRNHSTTTPATVLISVLTAASTS